ncbi:MAG TPA: hypothetical protein VD866_10865 [Urbifossiella sp.]|nr:hypothetical protein [Urbifossiella sp.]
MTRCLPAALLLASLSGCGGDGPSHVTGSVTLDGRPVADGAVTFVMTGGGSDREGAVIRDGAFEVKLKPGRYRVELTGQKQVGTRRQKGFDGKEEEVRVTEPLFPERFNTKSELVEDIKPGSNTMKFDLKSGR